MSTCKSQKVSMFSWHCSISCRDSRMSYITINTISRFSDRCFLRSTMAVVPNVSTMETVVASSDIRNLFPADNSFNPFIATKIRFFAERPHQSASYCPSVTGSSHSLEAPSCTSLW